MPRSKRAKVVHLSKVEKKGKELTIKTFDNVQECAQKYPYLFVFAVDNMRNQLLKDVRTQLSDSRLFFGKTKVMAKALGSSAATEPIAGTHLLAPHLHGAVGLIFTPRAPADIQAYVAGFRPLDYARAGSRASRGFVLPAGTLHSRAGEVAEADDVPLSHSVEPTLRKLGIPTRLVRGRVVLDNEHVVCREGDVLNSGQTALLKMFGVATAEFRIELRAYWSAETGAVEVLQEAGEGMEVDHAGQDNDDEVEFQGLD